MQYFGRRTKGIIGEKDLRLARAGKAGGGGGGEGLEILAKPLRIMKLDEFIYQTTNVRRQLEKQIKTACRFSFFFLIKSQSDK